MLRRPQGQAMITSPDGPTWEADTITCGHCNRVAFVKPGPDPGTGFCRQCMGHVCGPCADLGSCTPFEQQLERVEARARLLRSMGVG